MISGAENAPLSGERRKERGASLVLFTFLVTLLMIPIIGLAIDGAVVFWVKAKLSSAVDAAALAAGRSINVKYTQQQNSGSVVTIAQEWFSANFPSGFLGTSIVGGGPSVTVQPTQSGQQQVNVSAQVKIPLFFMSFLHFNSINISAVAQSTRRNTFALLVLDRSGSMEENAAGNACPTMQSDSINFVDSVFTEGFDTLGLITYSTTADSSPIDYGPSQTFKSGMASVINSISCTGATSMAQALSVAHQTIQSSGLPSGLNIVILFTDGQPNAIASNNWITNTAYNECLYSGGTWNSWWGSCSGGASSNTVYDPVNNQPPTYPPAVPPTWTGQSGCSANTLSGVFTILLNQGTTPSTYGYTGGIFSSANVSVNTSPGLISAAGCYFQSRGDSYAREDIAFLPTQDAYGNRTNAGYGANAPYYGNGVATIATYGSTATFKNQIRPDQQIPAVVAAAVNAADYQAQAMQNDPNYTIIIYTIGLGGAPDFPIDQTLLERIANDPRSPIYNANKPAGAFYYAPDPSQLNAAFMSVASQILHLTH